MNDRLPHIQDLNIVSGQHFCYGPGNPGSVHSRDVDEEQTGSSGLLELVVYRFVGWYWTGNGRIRHPVQVHRPASTGKQDCVDPIPDPKRTSSIFSRGCLFAEAESGRHPHSEFTRPWWCRSFDWRFRHPARIMSPGTDVPTGAKRCERVGTGVSRSDPVHAGAAAAYRSTARSRFPASGTLRRWPLGPWTRCYGTFGRFTDFQASIRPFFSLQEALI